VQGQYPLILCPWTAVLTPSKPWINWSGATATINHASIVLPTDLGTWPFNLTVTSLNWPLDVASVTYPFNVIIECIVSSLTASSQAANKNPYILNSGAFTTAALTVVQASLCKLPYTYTNTFQLNGQTIPQPTWLTWDLVTRKFSMTVTNVADIGLYTVTTTTSIP
jgi:hypothetical protein